MNLMQFRESERLVLRHTITIVHAPLVATGLVLLAASGCGSHGLAEVSGHVTFEGQPLDAAFVRFHPMAETLGPEFSGVTKEGAYKVPKLVPPGNYTVEIQSWRKTGRMVKGMYGETTEETVPAMPDRYFGPKTELSAQLVAGPNIINFDLNP